MHFDIRLCGMCTVFAPFSPLLPAHPGKSPAFHPFECHPFWSDRGVWAADAVALVRPVSTQSVGLLKALCFSTVFEHFRAVLSFFFLFFRWYVRKPSCHPFIWHFWLFTPHPLPLILLLGSCTQMAICAAAAGGGAASLKRSATKALTARDVGQKEVLSADSNTRALPASYSHQAALMAKKKKKKISDTQVFMCALPY